MENFYSQEPRICAEITSALRAARSLNVRRLYVAQDGALVSQQNNLVNVSPAHAVTFHPVPTPGVASRSVSPTEE